MYVTGVWVPPVYNHDIYIESTKPLVKNTHSKPTATKNSLELNEKNREPDLSQREVQRPNSFHFNRPPQSAIPMLFNIGSQQNFPDYYYKHSV